MNPTESYEDASERLHPFARWLRATHSPAHSRRTAEANAAFLLSRLRPGMRLLDVGCGPGSITIGLARAVSPGETLGIDLSATAVEAAEALAATANVPTVRFEQGNAYALPFDDASFDVVFAHAVLQHLDSPELAVGEMSRVLKPGGIVAVADADYGGSIIAPETATLTAAVKMMERVRSHSGGDTHVGRKLGALLAAAGFADVVSSATVAMDGKPEATMRTGEFWARYFDAPEFVAHVTAAGWATAEELAAMSAAWREWGVTPGAVWARFWCEAMGVK